MPIVILLATSTARQVCVASGASGGVHAEKEALPSSCVRVESSELTFWAETQYGINIDRADQRLRVDGRVSLFVNMLASPIYDMQSPDQRSRRPGPFRHWRRVSSKREEEVRLRGVKVEPPKARPGQPRTWGLGRKAVWTLVISRSTS